MQGTLRIIYEVIPAPGSNLETQIDTDELDPASFLDLAAEGHALQVIGASAVDVEVVIPDSCVVLLLSDVPVLLRLAESETQMRCRYFLVASEDADGKAITGRSLLLSGTGTPASVRLYYLGDT